MHVRGDQSPNQLVRRPLTAAQESKAIDFLYKLCFDFMISWLVD
jgi:hypothetical protein